MPRTTRLIINDETAVYHVMSRTALDGFPLGDIETPVKSASLISTKYLTGQAFNPSTIYQTYGQAG